jgi:hypothetical protein
LMVDGKVSTLNSSVTGSSNMLFSLGMTFILNLMGEME